MTESHFAPCQARPFAERKATLAPYQARSVGLPGLEGSAFLTQPNVLGLALSALMRWPREQRAEAAVEALARIVASNETPRRKLLLCDCVNSYAPLDETQRLELKTLLNDPKRREVQMFGKTWEEQGVEKGIEKGMEKGMEKGQRVLVRDILEARVGTLNESIGARLETWPAEKLRDLARALLSGKSLKEVGLED